MIGKTISHYKVIKKIGQGGMGVVYKAEDIKLERIVAIKFLSPQLSDSEEEKKRFIHEAKAASALEHNNICTVHEINETEEGQLFIVMSYVEGENLREKINAAPLKVKEAIEIAIQTAEGLRLAHKNGIVHRDLKPDNLMITREGTVKIMDFGLAKIKGRTRLTQLGNTLGTFSYMSPEQSRGEEVDNRSDIWSLGVVLYEMLTGQLPFKGDYEQAVVYSILNELPEPPTGLRTGIPLELERIINKLLEKQSEKRYQSLDDLIVDLTACLSTNISKKVRSGDVYKTVPPSMKKKYKIIISAFIAVLVLVLGYFLLLKNTKIEENLFGGTMSVAANSIAVLPFSDLSADKNQEYFCDGITEQIITNLSRLGKLKVIARTSVMKYKKTGKTIKEIGQELGITKILEGSVRKYNNQIRVTAQLINVEDGFHIWAEDYDTELKNIFKIQDDISNSIAKKLLQKLYPKEVSIAGYLPQNAEAYEYYLKGKYYNRSRYLSDHKIEDFNFAENFLLRSIDLDSTFALSYVELVDLYNTRCDFIPVRNAEFKHYFNLQEQYIEKAERLNPGLAEVHLAKAYLNGQAHKLDDSFKEIKYAYQLNQQSTETIFMMGRLYHNINHFDRAIEKFNKAIELDPLVSFYYAKRAWTYYRSGYYTKAEADFKYAIKLDSVSLPANWEYFIYLLSLNRLDEAATQKLNVRKIRGAADEQGLEALMFAAQNNKELALKTDILITWKFIVYTLLKMNDEALNILKNRIGAAFLWDYGCYYKTLLTDPLLTYLRDNPEFRKVVENQKILYDRYSKEYAD